MTTRSRDEDRRLLDRPFTRRRMFKAAAALGMGALAARFGAPSIAHAIVPRTVTRRFVFCYFGGGWDQLLFLDPREGALDREATLTETRYADLEGYEGFSSQVIRAGGLTFGPATEKPGDTAPKLSQFHERIAIVRGLNMGTLGHEIGYKHFLSGQFPIGSVTRGTTLACELAAQMESSVPIPNFSLQVEQQNLSHPGRYNAVIVGSLDDLMLVLDRDGELREADVVEEGLRAYAAGAFGCDVNVYDRAQLLTQMRGASDTATDFLRRDLAGHFRFAFAEDEASVALRARYGIPRGEASAPGARAAFAAQAIKLGLAQCVSVNMGVFVDTHGAGNREHARGLYPGISALAALLDDLSRSEAPEALQRVGGRTWLDHTTVVAFSEFGRTPLFNGSGGRDHHLGNSCLLAGAGIAGDRVVGESGAVGMGPGRYDTAMRRVVTSGDGGENLTPNHICTTLLASAGLTYDFTGFRSEPLWSVIQGA